MNVAYLSDKTGRFLNAPFAGLLLSLFVLTVLFFPVFYSDYAFLDEAHQLWHNRDDSNFLMDLVQGRWLTGLLYNKFFSTIATVSGLRWLRVISYFSWALFLEEFFRLGWKWQQLIGFDKLLLTIGGLYIACSLSVAVYIGWGVLFEIAGASLLGLWSGHLFFTAMMESKGRIHVILLRLLLIITSALGSLFMYQIAFGLFLLPLAFYLITKRSAASQSVILLVIGAYLLLALLYYLLFSYSLKLYSASASDRASISFDIVGKLGFFFSTPLSQAFSLNFLYNMHSILSQAFPILAMAGWVIAYLKTDKNKPGKKIGFIFLFIVFCMFVYLPVLVARENFASYRTMFVLNLVVSLLIIDTLLSLLRPKKINGILVIAFACCLIGVGFRNFRYNFIDPVRQEYRLLLNDFNARYDTTIRTVYFLRPPEDLFYPTFGINTFKDEFGEPSTFKDWTPEPLVKQFILERTKDRPLAERTKVIQFTDKAAFAAVANNPQPHALYVNVEAIFHTIPYLRWKLRKS